MTIPRIIHQTWKTNRVPDEWQACVRSWKANHPDWGYRLWTDEENRRFVETHYPDFLETYEAYPYNIQRADAVRYLILHRHGGLYADLDVECLRPIDELVSGGTFLACLEPRKHARWHGEKMLLSNALMASVPAHPFLVDVILRMKSMNPAITLHRDVLSTTGPAMLTRVAADYTGQDISILDDRILSPFTSDSRELDTLVNHRRDAAALKASCAESGSYAIHYWANTWVRNLAGSLVNPEPRQVKGYRFFPGLDSPGGDIGNVGRDIAKAAAECGTTPNAVGFNTDGFLKYRLLPRFKWVRIDNKEGNEGLYVKNNPRRHFCRRFWHTLFGRRNR